MLPEQITEKIGTNGSHPSKRFDEAVVVNPNGAIRENGNGHGTNGHDNPNGFVGDNLLVEPTDDIAILEPANGHLKYEDFQLADESQGPINEVGFDVNTRVHPKQIDLYSFEQLVKVFGEERLDLFVENIRRPEMKLRYRGDQITGFRTLEQTTQRGTPLKVVEFNSPEPTQEDQAELMEAYARILSIRNPEEALEAWRAQCPRLRAFSQFDVTSSFSIETIATRTVAQDLFHPELKGLPTPTKMARLWFGVYGNGDGVMKRMMAQERFMVESWMSFAEQHSTEPLQALSLAAGVNRQGLEAILGFLHQAKQGVRIQPTQVDIDEFASVYSFLLAQYHGIPSTIVTDNILSPEYPLPKSKYHTVDDTGVADYLKESITLLYANTFARLVPKGRFSSTNIQPYSETDLGDMLFRRVGWRFYRGKSLDTKHAKRMIERTPDQTEAKLIEVGLKVDEIWLIKYFGGDPDNPLSYIHHAAIGHKPA